MVGSARRPTPGLVSANGLRHYVTYSAYIVRSDLRYGALTISSGGVSNGTGRHGLRIAAFHVEPEAYRLVRDWAESRGHEIVLLVTTPGPVPRTYLGYRQVVAAAPPRTEILITTRFRRATPIIAAAKPDLLLSYTFPYRLPDALLGVAPLGAVNLHPAPLPRFRGPNPHRMIYEGDPTIGAALHRMAPEFDAGPTLSVQEAPLPGEPTIESVRELYDHLIVAALDEGVARAARGEWGEEQDDSAATYAAGFTPDEYWLDWRLSGDTLRRQAIALNLVETRARAAFEGHARLVPAVTPIPETDAPYIRFGVQAGDVIGRDGDVLIVMAGDGPVRVQPGDPVSDAIPDALLVSYKAPRRPAAVHE